MSGSLIPNGKQQYLDANGAPLAGGKVYYYIPYTTTAKNTWQDINLTILNTNPIILDSAGECIAWGSGAYRQQIYDVNDNLIWDQYTYGISPAGSNFISQEEVQTATQGQVVFTLATITYVPGINSLVVFVNGSKQVTGTNYTETAGNTVTFVTGLNAGDVVDFYASLPASSQNMSNAVNVAYVPPFPASATTNVQAKLAQTISTKDFGGNIQAAIDSLSTGDKLVINPGSYTQYNININKSNIVIENYGNFLLPANARTSIFKITEGVTDVTFTNYGVLDGNSSNQGDLNTIPLGTSIIEISNDTATTWTYRINIQNYGTLQNGANTGIYYHRYVADLSVNPAGYFVNHRNDGMAGDAPNARLRVENGIFSACGPYGQAINVNADYSVVNNIVVKNPNGSNSGISIGHSGTPQESGFYTEVTNCHIIDIGDSSVGLLIKAGLSDGSIISNNSFVRDSGITSGGIAIRIIGGVANGKDLVISNNSIAGPWGVGISAWDYSSSGYTFNNVVISGNYINVDSGSNSVGIQLYSGSYFTITGNQIWAALYGIETQIPNATAVGNQIHSNSVGIKVKDGSDYLACTSNSIYATSAANCIVLDAYDPYRLIALNLKNESMQGGIPVVPLLGGPSATSTVLAGQEIGGNRAVVVTLNNSIGGNNASTWNGGVYLITNVTDGTSALYAWTGSTPSAGFTILTSNGANWSTAYNTSGKEGIAYDSSGNGPFVFSQFGANKTYQIFCFGGA